MTAGSGRGGLWLRRASLALVPLLWLWLALPLAAQELSALARPDLQRSSLLDLDGGVQLRLVLSQPVPYRVFTLADPPRLVVDFREVDFAGLDPARLDSAARVTDLAWGRFRPGWSRLVAALDGPYPLRSAALEAGAGPVALTVRLGPADPAAFAARAGAPELLAGPGAAAPPAAAGLPVPKRRQTGAAPLVVVLDPGHGGIDPGAEAAGRREADEVLTFARELKELMLRAGMQVVMTREEDVFVPLETRISVARAAGADLFLSLHADALAEGEAVGATIYKLSAEASDAASEKLAERHDRADLLAGVDLDGHDDEVAGVLMDLARTETAPRADRLAAALAGAMQAAGIRMHRHPVQGADFSVLKSPDIPSVLLEVGFLSSEADRARLEDPAWRGRMEAAILRGVTDWAAADAAEARLIRQ